MMTDPEARRWPELPAYPGARASSRLAFGADYNPDQWPRETWAHDVRLMSAAKVNIVALAVFSWARIQPEEHLWDFEWLDEVMDLLHSNGIGVDLATATASPPPWLTTKHPEVLPVNRLGQTVWPGARQHWRPTSPIFREHAIRLVRRIAARYSTHPALVAWHVSNELGCHNIYDYSDDAAVAFREWLRTRYTTLENLNAAWGTAFWSQRYSHWEQVLPPRLAASHANPTQELDFKRFSSDALKEYLCAERDILRAITPGIPVTTNFMVMGETNGMDYADWAGEVDFVSNDHYVRPHARSLDELSFSANLTSGIARGAPWFLMEHSTSAVNWQPINVPKADPELLRDSLVHVAHGADAVCFFQWRQSISGAEKYHSAMVPHAGEDSEVFRRIVELGQQLELLAPVCGSRRKPARVGILFDWASWWASELDAHPTSRLRYRSEALDWYSALLSLGIRADVLPVRASLTGYDLVVAPILHVVPSELAQRLSGYVEEGGHLVTTYFSGIVDENDHVWPGGYPGALRDLLGIRIEEFGPLLEHESVELDNGTVGTLWTDRVDLVSPEAEGLVRYTTGAQTGRPAITRRITGRGSASYVSTRLGPVGLRPVLAGLLDAAGVASDLPEELRGRVEVTIRTNEVDDFWFVVNRGREPVELAGLDGDVLGGSILVNDGATTLMPSGVAVLRRRP